MSDDFRIEHDSLGEIRVPKSALYQAQTQRAAENFPYPASEVTSWRRVPRSSQPAHAPARRSACAALAPVLLALSRSAQIRVRSGEREDRADGRRGGKLPGRVERIMGSRGAHPHRGVTQTSGVIQSVAEDVASGKYDEHFPLSIFQTGASGSGWGGRACAPR